MTPVTKKYSKLPLRFRNGQFTIASGIVFLFLVLACSEGPLKQRSKKSNAHNAQVSSNLQFGEGEELTSDDEQTSESYAQPAPASSCGLSQCVVPPPTSTVIQTPLSERFPHKVHGFLNQLDVADGLLCGATGPPFGRTNYCANGNLDIAPSYLPSFTGLKQIAISRGRAIGVDDSDKIYYTKSITNPRWVELGGRLNQIDIDGNVVCGVEVSNAIWCAEQDLDVNPNFSGNWVSRSGSLKNISVSNGRLVGTSSTQQVWFTPDYSNILTWYALSQPGQFKQVSLDGNLLCAVSVQDELFCADRSITTAPNWTKLPGSIKYVSVSGANIYGVGSGVGSDGQIYLYPPPITGLPDPDLPIPPRASVSGTLSDSCPCLQTGGLYLPERGFNNSTNAPTIGFHTETAFPNETIAVNGERLEGADYVLWSEGELFRLQPLRSIETRAQIVVPTNVPNTYNELKKNSMMLLWPHNQYGYGKPVRINAPKIFWVWPGKKWTNDQDNPIRIFGKNLKVSGFTPKVVVQLGTGEPQALTVETVTINDLNGQKVSAYELRAFLPAGYAAGDYTVWAHNGTGGKYGWSNIGTFTVANNPYNYRSQSPIYVASQFPNQPLKTFREKVVQAIDIARLNGGGTIIFPPGNWELEGDVETWAAGIILKGAGRGIGGTTISRRGSSSPVSSDNPERFIHIGGAGSRIENMKLNGVGIKIRTANSVAAADVNIKDVQVILNNYPIELHGRTGDLAREKINLNIEGSVFRFVNAGAYIGWASYIRFDRCAFYGRYNDGVYDDQGNRTRDPISGLFNTNLDNHGITSLNTHHVIVENSSFQSEDPRNGKIMTRAILSRYVADNHVYQNNTMAAIGAFPSARNIDKNSGEVILLHGQEVGLLSQVNSSGPTWAIVNRRHSEFIDENNEKTKKDFQTFTMGRAIDLGILHAVVVSGRAAGEIALVKKINSAISNSTKTEIHVDRWPGLIPAANDKIMVRPIYLQNLILNNTIDSVPSSIIPSTGSNFGRIGIYLYSPAQDTVIWNNKISHHAQGIVIQSGGDTWVQGSNLITDNRIRDAIAGAPPSPGGMPFAYTKCYHDVGGQYFPNKGNHFYAFGNIFRNNYCQNAEIGVAVGTVDHDNDYYRVNAESYENLPTMGILHSIVENNTITGIFGPRRLGVAIAPSANWSLIRNNTMDRSNNIEYYLEGKTKDVLFIDK